MESKLSQMINIGKALGDKLIEADIKTPEELKSIGAEKLFLN
ncbi:TfoX/Sxy family DNA transformation protein [Flavobacterium mesophilum]